MKPAAVSASLREISDRLGTHPSEAQLDAVVAYGELLLLWASKINLTGARSMDDLVRTHLPDAFAASLVLSGPQRVLDVGSGAGLPALPLAVLCPEASFELYEPTGKKVAFLRTAVRELGLGGRVRVNDRRVEAAEEQSGDVAMSRATFAPEEWLSIGGRLVHPGGQVLVFLADRELASTGDLQLERSLEYRADRAPRRLSVFRRAS